MARRAGRRNGHRAPTAPTRVLFLHTATRPPLGADTWVHAQIMDRLDRTTHEVHAACATGPTDRPTPTYALLRTIPGVQIVPVHLGSERTGSPLTALSHMLWSVGPALLSFLRLAAYIRRNGITVLHTSDRPRDAVACVLLGRLTGAKSLIHVHVGWGEWMGPPLRWALRRADGLIAISAFVAETLTASGHDPDRTAVVLNGIDPHQWTPGSGRDEARTALGVTNDTAVILSVCRLFPEKGPADLIRAFAAIDGDGRTRLLIVGQEMTPGFAAELERLAGDLGVADRVTLAGRRDDVPRLMAAADVYAMPSFAEPFGLVYLEAMAMELPVVALDNGGTPEVVEDDVTGLLSTPGDGAALAANLRCLLDNPGQRRAMGQRGRQRVVANFTIERMADDVAEVYRSVRSSRCSTSQTGVVGVNSLSVSDLHELRRELDEQGYVVLRDVVSRAALTAFETELANAYAGQVKFKGGGTITGHLNCFPGRSARFVYDEVAAHGIVDAVKAMRPDQPNDLRVTMNYNLPGSVAQHYHIDGLYTDDFVICNIAVVDTDRANGAIDVLPGTNREFLPYWKFATQRTYRLTTRLPMRRGDVLVRRSNLWHRGMPNQTATPRPMMSLTFGERSAPQTDPFDGDIVFYPNWYSTSRLGVLRERTYAAAPVTYSAYRFAKSLRGNKGYSSY